MFKADWVNGDTVDGAAMNTLAATVNRVVTPEDFGAVGDGLTDDTNALTEMFNDYTVANGGSCILIPYGKVYGTAALDIKSNTFVFGGGTLKMLYDDGWPEAPYPGVFLTFKNGVSNVTWVGPTLDINGKLDVNGFDVGQDNPAPDGFKASDIYIVATVKGARIKTALEDSNNTLFAGGGKAIALGSASRNVYANIRALDCDIGGAFEVTTGGVNDVVENVVIDLQTNNCHRAALYVNGAFDATAGSLDSARYAYSVRNGVKIRLRAQGGQDGLVTDTTTGDVDLTNYSQVGVITLNGASGVDIDAYIAMEERCTLVRGMATASRIRINALMDELEDGWNTNPCTTHAASGTFMADNIFEANIHAATHQGVLVRPHRETGNLSMIKTKIDVNAWCENGVGAPTQVDGTTDGFGISVAYRFCDMRTDPIREVVGHSGDTAIPTWADVRRFDTLSVGNVSANNVLPDTDSTPNAGGTTTLSLADAQVQEFTGTGNQTCKLPTTDVPAGHTVTIINNSSGLIYIQASNGSALLSEFPAKAAVFVALVDTPTAPADWQLTGYTIKSISGSSTIAQRDSDANLFAGNFIADAAPTTTAAGVLTLDISASQTQVFTGTTTHTVKLPTTDVPAGKMYTVCNNSSGVVTVQSSGANEITTVAGGATKLFVAQVDTPTTAAHWRAI